MRLWFKDINLVDGGGSGPSDFTELNGLLYFVAEDFTYGREIWVTDGTSDNTLRLKDINPGVSNSLQGANFVEYQGKLYFTANDGTTGSELWFTDGTSDGTR